MNEALDQVRGSRRRRAASWVQRFGSIKRLRHRTAVVVAASSASS